MRTLEIVPQKPRWRGKIMSNYINEFADFDLEFWLEFEKHVFMRYTVLYRSETKRQVLSKGRLLRYQTFGIPEDPEERKQVLEEELFWHEIMEHVYSETIEWPIINLFRHAYGTPVKALVTLCQHCDLTEHVC